MKKYPLLILLVLSMLFITMACKTDGKKPDVSPKDGPITIKEIGGVTVPMTMLTPVKVITATAQFTGTVVWTPTPVDNKFAADTQYKATITLTPAKGFTLTGVAANSFTVAGTSIPATNSKDSGTITATFPQTGSTTISVPSIKGIFPVTGAEPIKEVDYPQYKMKISWEPDPGAAFANGVQYTAIITFEPLEGLTVSTVGIDVENAASVTTNMATGGIDAVFLPTISSNGYGVIPDVTKVTDPTTFSAETSKLTFNFSDQIPNLSGITADHIIITDGTGSVQKGTLTGDGEIKVLALLPNVKTGDITITVNYPGVETAPRTVSVYGEQDLIDIINAMTRLQKAGQFIMPTADNNTAGPPNSGLAFGMYLFGGGGRAGDTTQAWTTKMENFYNASPSFTVNGEPVKVPIIFGIDAVHGVCNQRKATFLQHNIGLGAIAAGNIDIGRQDAYDSARITAEEMNALNVNVAFNPCVTVAENARWGRFYESFSSNIEVTATLALASIRGLQDNRIAACLKHFMGEGQIWNNNPENNGTISTATLSLERTIEVAEPYKRAIESWAMMPSFNRLIVTGSGKFTGSGLGNDGRMHQQKALIQDLYKDEWGWTGACLGDWGAHVTVNSVNAGVDSLMTAGSGDQTTISNSNSISNDRVDDGARRMLRLKKRVGLFDSPTFEAGTLRDPANVARAREIAADSMVLLRNKNNLIQKIQNLEFKNIMVAGRGSSGNVGRGVQHGGWTVTGLGGGDQSTANVEAVTVLEGLQAIADSTPGITVTGSTDGSLTGNFDLIIAVVAENAYGEGGGNLPTNLNNNGCILNTDNTMLQNIYNNHPSTPILVVIFSGRPIPFSTAKGSGDNAIRDTKGREFEKWDALIAAWLPGGEAGSALADLLFTPRDFVAKTAQPWFEGLMLAGPSYGLPDCPVNSGIEGWLGSNTATKTEDGYIGIGEIVYPYGYGLNKKSPLDTDKSQP